MSGNRRIYYTCALLCPYSQSVPKLLHCAHLLELMKTAVFFILLKKSLLHRPCVSGVKEHETTTKSLSHSSVSNGTEGRRQRDTGERQETEIISHYVLCISVSIEYKSNSSFPSPPTGARLVSHRAPPPPLQPAVSAAVLNKEAV